MLVLLSPSPQEARGAGSCFWPGQLGFVGSGGSQDPNPDTKFLWSSDNRSWPVLVQCSAPLLSTFLFQINSSYLGEWVGWAGKRPQPQEFIIITIQPAIWSAAMSTVEFSVTLSPHLPLGIRQ